MIKVDRHDVGVPAVFSSEDAEEEREHNEAESAKTDPDWEFEIYKDDGIKEALFRLFAGKCAYCESRYAATQPMDVEHYRPKSVVEKWKDAPARDRGYYWLAGEWTNLLPSCIDCNRRRGHPLEGGGEVMLGKRAIFPVADEAKRWTHHDDDDEEEPLLLDPCRNKPEWYLAFRDTGVVEPRGGNGTLKRRRADTSIEVYGLNRPGLVEERLAVIRVLQHRMEEIEITAKLFDDLSAGPNLDPALVDAAEDLLFAMLARLREHVDPAHPYAQTATQVIGDFLASFE